MLVNDAMTRHPIMIAPEAAASEAEKMMSEGKVRHLPVVGDGKRLVGLVTRERLGFKPETLSSLNVWEITRYLSNLTVKQIMLPVEQVLTIQQDRTIERAASIMAERKVGCLPVVQDGVVVGIITEVDLLNTFQEMLGLPVEGVRVTVRMPDRPGEFAKLTKAIGDNSWGVMGIGSIRSPRQDGYYDVVLKIRGADLEAVRRGLANVADQTVVDIRTVS